MLLFVVLVGALVTLGGGALHQAGFQQGYAAGLAGTEADANALPPYAFGPYRHVGYGYGFGFPLLCGVGLLFLAGMFLLGGVGKMFAYRHWRHHGGPGRAHWGRKWHHYHYGDPGDDQPPFRKGDTPAKKDAGDDPAPDEA